MKHLVIEQIRISQATYSLNLHFPFSLTAWHPESPLPGFLQGIQPPFSQPSAQGSRNGAGFFMPGATSGTASNATHMSCLHSFPHTPDTSSICTRSGVLRITNKHNLKKIKFRNSAKPQSKKHHKNLAVLTAELQLEQRFYTFGEDFETDKRNNHSLYQPVWESKLLMWFSNTYVNEELSVILEINMMLSPTPGGKRSFPGSRENN